MLFLVFLDQQHQHVVRIEARIDQQARLRQPGGALA